jgi:hypothetical protein
MWVDKKSRDQTKAKMLKTMPSSPYLLQSYLNLQAQTQNTTHLQLLTNSSFPNKKLQDKFASMVHIHRLF